MADENYFSTHDVEELLEEKGDLLTENKRLTQDVDHLCELLRDARNYARHPDYDWDIDFARDVDRALGEG